MESITRFDRLELKFRLTRAQAQTLRAALVERLLPDPHAGPTGRYPIIGTYLDNQDRDIYVNQLMGLPSRRKVRVRVYGQAADHPEGICFLEVKHKYGGRTSKRRLGLSAAEAQALLAGDPLERPLDERDRLVLTEVRRMVLEMGLAPVCIMRYDREAWTGQGTEADLRVTFDSGLRARARDLLRIQADDPDFDLDLLAADERIVEIKVDQSVPLWLARLVADLGLHTQSCSKYQLAVEALGLRPKGLSIALPEDWALGRQAWTASQQGAALSAAAGKDLLWTPRPTF